MAAEPAATEPETWIPLECNPDVLTSYLDKLGVDVSKTRVHEVLSLEDWALSMVPRPVLAVILLYPKDAHCDFDAAEEARISTEGQVVSPQLRFFKQTIPNACGTMALLHALGNSPPASVAFGEGSCVQAFLEATRSMSPGEAARHLERDCSELAALHRGAATDAAGSALRPEDMGATTHYACFSGVDGHLYELDGRKARPVNHGPHAEASLLEDSCRAIRGFMARDPKEVRFTILALAAAE